jgi:hypothetical protein
LAAQAVISSHSKAKYYDGNAEEELPEDVGESKRDAIGIVRAICVKVCPYIQLHRMYF